MRITITVKQDGQGTGKTTVFNTEKWSVSERDPEHIEKIKTITGKHPQFPVTICADEYQDNNDGSRGGEIKTFYRYAEILFLPAEIPKLIEGLTSAGYLSSNMVTALEEARDKIDSVLKTLRPNESDQKE